MFRFIPRFLQQADTAYLNKLTSQITTLEKSNATLRKEVDSLRQSLQSIIRKSTTMSDVSFYAECQPTTLNLSSIIDFCTNPNYSTHVFCHRELPIRFAQQVLSLGSMPHGLGIMDSVLKVKQIHLDTFEAVRDLPVPQTPAHKDQFDRVLKDIQERHSNVLNFMAEGLIQFKLHIVRHKIKVKDESKRMVIAQELLETEYPNVKTSLDAFFNTMIGVNFLIRQHLAVESQRIEREKDDAVVGIIAHRVDLESVVRSAVENAKEICSQHYGDSPIVKIKRVGPKDMGTDRAYIPEHIHYVVTELLKNALRATVEHSIRLNGRGTYCQNTMGLIDCDGMAPIHVTIIDDPANHEHVAIVVNDTAGGFRRSVAPRVMSYMYTTAESVVGSAGSTECKPSTSPLAGYGYGLPLSRLYARHFGGDIVVNSVPGYGTDAVLLIPSHCEK
eukprot:PhF_6_TR36002/c0_g1_i1/m.52165/K00898/PDK2_3_4; pyruvate dehydrogenase kinase 2/3/4